MFGLPAVEILGDARVHDPVAKLEMVLIRSVLLVAMGCPTPTLWSIYRGTVEPPDFNRQADREWLKQTWSLGRPQMR